MNDKNFFWGGPVHKIQVALKIERESEPYILRKFLFYCFFTWLPLLILNLINSTVLNPGLQVSLFTDYVVWARFFVALPLLFISERMIRLQVGDSLIHFIKSGIVSDNNRNEYESLLDKLNKIRDSKTAEVIILIVAYLAVFLFWRVADENNLSSSWIFNESGNISSAGYWYYFVSAPVFQFFLYRMIWKFFLWVAFLYKISKMELNLIPTNPDLSGGLRFLGVTQIFFGFIGLAQSSVTSSQIAEWITVNNSRLEDYYVTIAINVFISVFLLMSPMLLFFVKLFKVKLKGIMDYGVVSNKYVTSFNDRWVNGINPDNEKLLGTGDIQSLADLFNSFQIVEKMRVLPIDMMQIIYLILILSIPFLPLITFIVPPKEILENVIKFFI